MDDIVHYYHIDEASCFNKLAYLDKLKIIDLLPKNKIRLKVAANFSWLENGPIQQFFQDRIAADFFNTRFKAEDENLTVLNGMLSSASNKEFQRKMKRLAKEFDELNQDDVSLDVDKKLGYTALIAIRRWNYGVFKPLIK